MSLEQTSDVDGAAAYIAAVGRRVRLHREALGLSRRQLTEQSGVSQRYLAQLELGTGNISISLLRQLALALDCRVTDLIDESADPDAQADIQRAFELADPSLQASILAQLQAGSARAARAERVALIGLRGAGKSTLGAALAAQCELPFFELDQLIAERSGLSTADVMAVYGPEGYRRFERDALLDFIGSSESAVVAVPGGVVGDSTTFATLRARCHTVWVRTDPAAHMARVRGQGDLRPMEGHPAAMAALKALLAERAPFYGQADCELDTSGQLLNASVKALCSLVSDAGWLHTATRAGA